LIDPKGEFKEVEEELRHHKPTKVYHRPNSNKPEGAPTELADIIILIVDYFGACDPKIDIDEHFLGSRSLLNLDALSEEEPLNCFLRIKEICSGYISKSMILYCFYGNDNYIDIEAKKDGVSVCLHNVLRLILAFCKKYNINMQKELLNKLTYNSTRKSGYRKVGKEPPSYEFKKVWKCLTNDGKYPVPLNLIIETIKKRKEIEAVVEKRRKEAIRIRSK